MRELVAEIGLARDRIPIVKWSWLDCGVGGSFDTRAASCCIKLPASLWSFLGVSCTLEPRFRFAIDTTFSVQYSAPEV